MSRDRETDRPVSRGGPTRGRPPKNMYQELELVYITLIITTIQIILYVYFHLKLINNCGLVVISQYITLQDVLVEFLPTCVYNFFWNFTVTYIK